MVARSRSEFVVYVVEDSPKEEAKLIVDMLE